jgi:hypothetical protein
MTNRRQLTWVSAWNICCGVEERETSFWIILSEGMSPGVCTMIQRLNMSQQWKLRSSPCPNKSCAMPTADKIMLTLFFNYLGTSADRLVLTLFFNYPGTSAD